MVPAATTVGGYLQSLPNDRRVAMARVCSMIRRSARGVRESMRFGLAFYELDGPLFAVESHEKSLVLYLAERDVVKDFKDKIKNIDIEHCRVEFPDLNCLSLDVVEKLVRASLVCRRARKASAEEPPSQADLVALWGLTEKDVVRHELVQRIVKAYAEYESKKPKDRPEAKPHRFVRRREEK